MSLPAQRILNYFMRVLVLGINSYIFKGIQPIIVKSFGEVGGLLDLTLCNVKQMIIAANLELIA